MNPKELIYIDWNLLSILRNPKLEPHKILANFLDTNRERFKLVYSEAHLDDLAKSNNRNDSLVKTDLKYISDKTKGLAIVKYFGRGYVDIEYRDPAEFYESNIADSTSEPFSQMQLVVDQMTSQFGPIRDNVIRTHFKTDPKEICNFSVSQLDELIKRIGISNSIKGFIEFGLQLRGNASRNPLTHIDYYMTGYMNLDLIGFFPDSLEGKQSFNNLLNDSKHSAYGSMCKAFITNDNKCYHKSKLLFEYFDCDSALIKTCKLKGNLDNFRNSLNGLVN